jgi:hypothetical protein
MRGKMIGRRGVEGESKATTAPQLWEDERRPSWLFVSQKMRGERFFWRSIYKKRLQIVKFGNLLNKS